MWLAESTCIKILLATCKCPSALLNLPGTYYEHTSRLAINPDLMVSLSHLNKIRLIRQLKFTEWEYGPNAILSLREPVSADDFASIPLLHKSLTTINIQLIITKTVPQICGASMVNYTQRCCRSNSMKDFLC